MRTSTMVYVGILLFGLAIGIFGYLELKKDVERYYDNEKKKIEAIFPSPTPEPSPQEEADEKVLAYWNEPIVSPDGKCRCPGGKMCTSCQEHPDKPCTCKPTRLDFWEARQRFERVLRNFRNAIDPRETI